MAPNLTGVGATWWCQTGRDGGGWFRSGRRIATTAARSLVSVPLRQAPLSWESLILEQTVLTGVFASLADIVTVVHGRRGNVEARNVLAQFKRRQQEAGSPEKKIGDSFGNREVMDYAAVLVGINDHDPIWLRRTTQKAFTPFLAAMSEHELNDEALKAKASETVTELGTALKRAEEDYNGLPTDDYKQLKTLFGC